MRSTKEIQDEIITYKEQTAGLEGLNSTSQTAIWRLWVSVVASAIWVLENLFFQHKKEVTEMILEQKPHTAKWYRTMAKRFQWGFNLLTDSDQFNNLVTQPNGTTAPATTEQVEDSKIIKYAAVTESTAESRLIIKIATENAGELQPITAPQKEAFVEYINEIKDAGVRLTVINYLPDLLNLKLKIYRNPLVINAEGVNIISGKKTVEEALKEFMKKLPFNGELVLAHLIDELQKIEGVEIPHLVQAQTSWIDAGTGNYGQMQNIDVRQLPVSGYFKITTFDEIEYVV